MDEIGLSRAELLGMLLRCAIEAVILLGGGYLLLKKTTLWESLAALGRMRLVVTGFLALWAVVQLTDRFQYHFPPKFGFFPLARFAMYQIGWKRRIIETYRLEGEWPGGERRELNPTLAFSGVDLPSMHTRFRTMREALAGKNPKKQAWAKEQIRLYGASFLRYFRAHGEAPPERIRFVNVQHDLERVGTRKADSLVGERVLYAVEAGELP
jgi:hypothetical protein